MHFSVLLYVLSGMILVPFVHGQIHEYHFINLKRTWTAAQQYCRQYYTDLATVESAEDLMRMNIPAGVSAWIGLFDDPASWRGVMTSDPNSWRWSATGTTSPGGYQNWFSFEPNKYGGKEACVFIQNNVWKDYECTHNETCLCYRVQSGVKEFVLNDTGPRTWADCQTYCRQHYHHLAMIENATEDQHARDAMAKAGVASAWIGLSREIWRWSDNSNSNFRNWARGEPNNGNGNFNEHCVTVAGNREWADQSCGSTFPFVCHRVKKTSISKTTVKLQTSVDLTNPAIREQVLKLLEERLKDKYAAADFKLRWSKPPTKQKEEEKKKKDMACKAGN